MTSMSKPECNNVSEPTLLDGSSCDPTPEQLGFLLSKISGSYEDALKRVHEVRKQAYEHFPYPCIRHFTFLKLAMAMHPAYQRVIEAGRKSGNTFLLDLGCCMGTDARKAAHDGYPEENVIACDLHEEYLRLGYKLYGDESDCKISFFAADIFAINSEENVEDSPSSVPTPASPQSPPASAPSSAPKQGLPVRAFSSLRQLKGKLTHIYAGLLFHLFDEDTQTRLAECLALLVSRDPGVIVFGRHEGREEPGFINRKDERTRFGHSIESWEKLWRETFTRLESEKFVQDRLRFRTKLHASRTPMPDFPDSKWLFWAFTIT